MFFVCLFCHPVTAVGASKMLLRVIVSPQDIRRVTLELVPESVNDLCEALCTSLGLQGSFILQFEDPDFGNELCDLTDIKDLPTDRATLCSHFLIQFLTQH